MTLYTVYDATGRIQRSGTCQDALLEHQAEDGEFVLPLASDDALQWIKDGALMLRPRMILEMSRTSVPADGQTEIWIDGIPVGARLTLQGPVNIGGVAEATFLLLTFAVRGSYKLTITHFPYIEEQVILYAV